MKKAPGPFRKFVETYPRCGASYEALAAASREAAGFGEKEAELLKLALSMGSRLEGAVHSTMRSANDRGYECLLLSDCTGATDVGNYEAALKMVTMQGGVFGAVATSEALLASLDA